MLATCDDDQPRAEQELRAASGLKARDGYALPA
jgi:hypothetical protein